MIAQVSSTMTMMTTTTASSRSAVVAKKNSSSSSSFTSSSSSLKAIGNRNTKNTNNKKNNNNVVVARASLMDDHYEVISNLAKGGGGGIPGVDTSEFDQMFINVASFILPAWGIIVGTIFVFGTIAKVAFPEKYDEMTTKAEKESFKGQIDLDNLSADDLAAVAELEAEMKAKGKM